MVDPGPAWRRDEEFRQSVIRKALLLGFEAEQYEHLLKMERSPDGKTMVPVYVTWWRFKFSDGTRSAYASLYSAAYDYCRIMGLPDNVIGDFRG